MQQSGSTSGDPRFRVVSAPDAYPRTTQSAIRFVPVTKAGVTMGYVWAAMTNDAASFLPRSDARPESGNLAVQWAKRLRWAKATNLPPLDILRVWAGAPENECGYIPEGSEEQATSLAELAALAG